MQSKLIVGDSFNMLNTYADYPASAGWTLKTTFTPRASTASKITLTATAEGDSYRTQVAPSTTVNWTAGRYAVHQWVEKSGQRVTVATGDLDMLPDPNAITPGYDPRSHVEKTLANIELMIEGKATKDVQEYTIGDRQLKHIPLPELLKLRDKYKLELYNERNAKTASKGTGVGRKIFVRT